MRGIEAPGLSSGGIWTVEANATGVWTPERCEFIGIEHAWLRWKWVKGSQVQHFLALVARTIPDLAATIRSTHPSI
jgi:hypothetical protein